MIGKIVFLFILVIANAFFSASEIALISVNDNKISIMAKEGNKKAKKILNLLSEPSRFLATIQVGITLAGFLASAFAAESFAGPVVNLLSKFNLPVSTDFIRVLTVIVITIILSFFTLVFGELVPKRIAMNKAESIAFAVVSPLRMLSKVASPFVNLLTVTTNSIVRLFGIKSDGTEKSVTEEEIRMLIDVGKEKGTIQEHEKIMINNIFEFNNKKVEDIMTHRLEITAVPNDISLPDLVRMICRKKYSRLPVYEENIDNIVGVLSTKDLLCLINRKDLPEYMKTFKIERYMRKPQFVLTYRPLDTLFAELQETKTHMGIVIDEYGGTAGIVTIEDLVEEIVGNIFDEHDTVEDFEIIPVGDNIYEAIATISLLDLEDYLGIELPTDEFDTLNGFLINLFGKIPTEDEVREIEYKNMKIRILELTDKRIEKVTIRIEE